jgi:prephenate dehydrogenase
VGAVTLGYWILLFLRMRVRSRRAFDRAFDQAAAAHAGRESFNVTVSTDVRPARTAVIVFAVPVALVIIHLFIAR